MEGYSFVNIFATKNIDYLLAVVSLLVLIPFWMLLNGKKTKALIKRSSDKQH